MNHNGLATGPEESSGRHWSFGDCEFDEISRQLRVQGRLVESESKPLDLLLQLLLHAGEVVTKEELLEAIWPDVMVVDGSLATAVSKLRRAIGEDEGHPLIVTIPRVGYRLAVPVHCRTIAAVSGPDLALKPGDCVPGRSMWRLERSLDASGSGEVWLGRNPRTSEERVFKFAVDGLRLKALKREITVSRFLRESLGERPEFVRILEWNLTTPPFFLESEYAGPNLVEWADSQGGLARCPLATRLQLLIEIAHTVAAAHSVGVLHKDLKPANILVQVRPGGGWQIRIADFGSASLFDPARLRVLGITNLGFTHTVSPERQPITGTLMYMAPEILAGHSPSIGSDVYALGVMLYQFVIGDLRRPLAPGWENDIHDPLLPEDIAAAACGDPARRLGSAGELVDRLRSLEQRRLRRSELESAQIRARIAEQRLARTRARRPWILAAAAALIL
ncbi:MAG: winged helix-turn-helix domain-containing protein, partial [Acidobacteriaceae bacterium]